MRRGRGERASWRAKCHVAPNQHAAFVRLQRALAPRVHLVVRSTTVFHPSPRQSRRLSRQYNGARSGSSPSRAPRTRAAVMDNSPTTPQASADTPDGPEQLPIQLNNVPEDDMDAFLDAVDAARERLGTRCRTDAVVSLVPDDLAYTPCINIASDNQMPVLLQNTHR